ncbi:MAG: hypothetical protein HY078_14765 [Elusimicrobia bacterium]|nr:hypothetical protein [Elusimicrobiota bacterium]
MTRHHVRILPFLLAVAAAGCGFTFGLKNERSAGIESEIQRSERNTRESRTLSNLAAIENALSDFIKAEGKIPPRLDFLVPKYLSEVPSCDSAIGHHKESNDVRVYPSTVIRNGAIDGSQIRDTGNWGYVFNDRQVIVFVDCKHMSTRGKPWYLERGVF